MIIYYLGFCGFPLTCRHMPLDGLVILVHEYVPWIGLVTWDRLQIHYDHDKNKVLDLLEFKPNGFEYLGL